MNADKIKINGLKLSTILHYYHNIHILINYAIQTKESGGKEVLDTWDEVRARTPSSRNVELEIEGFLYG